jgi:STE24 endopeptidase
LNLKALDPGLPNEFQGYYDEEKYARSQEYTRVNTRFAFFTTSFDLIVILVFILSGGFNFVDQIIRGFGLSTLPSGLAFFGILFFASDLISTPFSLYQNFVIEEENSELFDSEDDGSLQEFSSSDDDDNNSEEDDLEIPAFLRRQKN